MASIRITTKHRGTPLSTRLPKSQRERKSGTSFRIQFQMPNHHRQLKVAVDIQTGPRSDDFDIGLAEHDYGAVEEKQSLG